MKFHIWYLELEHLKCSTKNAITRASCSGLTRGPLKTCYELREWIETKAVKSLLQPQLVKYSAFVSVLAQLEHFWG